MIARGIRRKSELMDHVGSAEERMGVEEPVANISTSPKRTVDFQRLRFFSTNFAVVE
jgi:hypothetical protein